MLAANLHQSMSYAFFKVNQKDIASQSCEMREVDNNNCQGSCVLRELLEPAKQKEQSPLSLLELKLDDFLAETSESIGFIDFPRRRETIGLYCEPLFEQSLIFKIWRPPQLIA
tara:strand:- start:5550 stop:5888 length:339 start_codon:yes stop_codon:yes gene_type:complete